MLLLVTPCFPDRNIIQVDPSNVPNDWGPAGESGVRPGGNGGASLNTSQIHMREHNEPYSGEVLTAWGTPTRDQDIVHQV